MPFLFRTCNLEMDYETYITFLIRHHDELNLPYSFAMKLSFISSPLVLGKAMVIIDEDSYEIAAAVGFVYGTGAADYEDKHICQIEVAFIQQEYRATTLFIKGLRALNHLIKENNPDVLQIQFWAPSDQADLDRLFSKFASLPGASKSIVNHLVLYTLPFEELVRYGERFNLKSAKFPS
ncbi:hypothetical protein [Paenibacillus sp. FSL E2-0201]|uniref:hypothetical protein n=1 Tax=Paenibacillus sp. FSL E2-0201 TaxID=2954726 RepID=UPI0030DC327D